MTGNTPIVTAENQSGALVLTIHEPKLRDLLVVQSLKEQMLNEVEKYQASKVLLNMQHVQMVGSVAFLAFLGLRRQPTVDRVILCHTRPEVLELFQLCKLIANANHKAGPFEAVATIADAL